MIASCDRVSGCIPYKLYELIQKSPLTEYVRLAGMQKSMGGADSIVYIEQKEGI
jgi:hypothetical protein